MGDFGNATDCADKDAEIAALRAALAAAEQQATQADALLRAVCRQAGMPMRLFDEIRAFLSIRPPEPELEPDDADCGVPLAD